MSRSKTSRVGTSEVLGNHVMFVFKNVAKTAFSAYEL